MSLAELVAPLWGELKAVQKRLVSVSPATVTSVGPVRIQVDGQAAPVAASPDSLVPITAGDRVRVLRYGTSHLILGVIRAAPTWQTLPAVAGWGDGTVRILRTPNHATLIASIYAGDIAPGAWRNLCTIPATMRPSITVPGGAFWNVGGGASGHVRALASSEGTAFQVYPPDGTTSAHIMSLSLTWPIGG